MSEPNPFLPPATVDEPDRRSSGPISILEVSVIAVALMVLLIGLILGQSLK